MDINIYLCPNILLDCYFEHTIAGRTLITYWLSPNSMRFESYNNTLHSYADENYAKKINVTELQK
jgi:hypothetical protein